MRVARDLPEAARRARELPKPVGLVPTMGALHAGHRALVARARDECAALIATIFVNPLQFGPNEDFGRYPRAFENDVAQLEALGVDLLFAPAVESMYPAGFTTSIDPGEVAARYDGALRPGHFQGVATVCTKLFNIAGAERGYFGAKDAQQVAVLRRITRDLDVPIELVIVPTVREEDGLALSSRNAYLSAEQRAAAPRLYGALRAMQRAVDAGETARERILAAGRPLLSPPLREAYLDVVDPETFAPVERIVAAQPALAIGSAWLGTTRLIDNVPLPAAA